MFRSTRSTARRAAPLALLALAGCGTGGAPAASAPTAAVVARPPAAVVEPAPIPAGRAPAPGEYAGAPDVRAYDIELALPPAGGAIAARATLDLEAPRGVREVALDLTGLAVTAATVDGRPVQVRQDAGKVHVPLPGAGGGRHRVELAYAGTPDDGLIQQANVHGDPSVFADNWPNRARFWFPSVDHPSDKATIRFQVHAPSAWTVIANGALTGEPAPTAESTLRALGYAGPAAHRTWVWASDVEIPAYTMVVGAAVLAERSVGTAACGNAPASPRPDGCIDVGYLVFPADTARAAPSFRRAARMVDYFTDRFGPFPYEKLMNVQSSTRFGGMENASAIFYSENAIARGADIEGTVSHEIAHQWFGDSATEAEWSHLWLSEGFATYFGDQFFEDADGVEAFRALMEENRRSYIGSPVVGQPILSESEDLFALLNANNYPKGGWVLHMLRGLIGDEAFFAGIRDYYAAYEGGNALSDDFQRVMEAASGQDLDGFFDQWLHQPGYPIFEVEWTWDPSAGAVRYRIAQVQDPAWPTFRMPIELEARTERGPLRTRVQLDGRVHEGTFPTRSAPHEVVLDPDGWVLKDVRPASR